MTHPYHHVDTHVAVVGAVDAVVLDGSLFRTTESGETGLQDQPVELPVLVVGYLDKNVGVADGVLVAQAEDAGVPHVRGCDYDGADVVKVAGVSVPSARACCFRWAAADHTTLGHGAVSSGIGTPRRN